MSIEIAGFDPDSHDEITAETARRASMVRIEEGASAYQAWVPQLRAAKIAAELMITTLSDMGAIKEPFDSAAYEAALDKIVTETLPSGRIVNNQRIVEEERMGMLLRGEADE